MTVIAFCYFCILWCVLPTTTMLGFCGVRFLQGLSLHCLWSFEVDSVFHYGYFKPWAAFWQKINAQEIIFWCWKFSTKKYVNKICNIWKKFSSAQIFCQKALNSRKNSRNLIFNPQPLEAMGLLWGSHILSKRWSYTKFKATIPTKNQNIPGIPQCSLMQCDVLDLSN